VFSSIGAEAFAERARRELVATGETRVRAVHTLDELTSQEAQIARPRPRRLRTPRWSAALHQPATVQYHLHKVFQKLTSRHATS
jgi:hypothetical protein